MPTSTTRALSSPTTIPTFGTSGTRRSGMTQMPSAISVIPLGSTSGAGGPSTVSLMGARIYLPTYTRAIGADSDRYERGLDAFASQFGIERKDVAPELVEAFGERFAQEAIPAVGGAWPDDALSLRDRSLIVVAALVVQGGLDDRLRTHVRWAIEHGSSREELEALVTLLAVYAGYPRASVAMEVVRDELDRLESESS
jgi:4-carboxymuconolactone decarboxylase